MVSPQYLRYAAGSEKEKGAGGRLHGGTIAHPFVFCKGGGVAGEARAAAAVGRRGGRGWGWALAACAERGAGGTLSQLSSPLHRRLRE